MSTLLLHGALTGGGERALGELVIFSLDISSRISMTAAGAIPHISVTLESPTLATAFSSQVHSLCLPELVFSWHPWYCQAVKVAFSDYGCFFCFLLKLAASSFPFLSSGSSVLGNDIRKVFQWQKAQKQKQIETAEKEAAAREWRSLSCFISQNVALDWVCFEFTFQVQILALHH